MIQIRNVPPELHKKLKAKAAAAGMSLSDYLLRGAQRMADELSVDEFRMRLALRSPVTTGIGSADAIRAERDRM